MNPRVSAVAPELLERYRRQLADADPVVAQVARLQLERLEVGRQQRLRAAQRRPDATTAVTPRDNIRPWRARLRALVEASGNPPVRWRGPYVFECGHNPYHPSKSGAPVLVDLVDGSYWCRSCGERGGSAEWVMHWQGIPIKSARRLLEARFGDGAPKPEDLEAMQ